jgi:hypothetical protein
LHETANFGSNGNAPSQKDEENMTKNQQMEEEALEPSSTEVMPTFTTSGTTMEESMSTRASVFIP